MIIRKWAALMLAVGVSLTACGGGGSGGDLNASSNGNATSSGSSNSEGSSDSDGGSVNPQAGSDASPPAADSSGGEEQDGFSASVASAPADGATLANRVRLEIEGSGIENAELLPAAGGRPYALFDVAADQSRAWVEFDTRTLSNGEVQVVIDAYDRPPRTSGARAIRAMQPRTWTIQNPSLSSPYPGDYPLRRDAAPLQEKIDMSEEEFARMIDNEWPRVHALLQEYIPNNVVFEPPVPRGFEGPRSSCIQDAYAAPEACREYMIRIVMLLQ